jgi:hypothetical protein
MAAIELKALAIQRLHLKLSRVREHHNWPEGLPWWMFSYMRAWVSSWSRAFGSSTVH